MGNLRTFKRRNGYYILYETVGPSKVKNTLRQEINLGTKEVDCLPKWTLDGAGKRILGRRFYIMDNIKVIHHKMPSRAKDRPKNKRRIKH